MKNRLSLCMIVRNEEKNLPRCLESVRNVVDEMIIVDTGSVDQTPQIAERFGAKVIFYPWSHDFSQARNVAIKAAAGEWILSLDADEALSEQTRNMIARMLDAPDVEGYLLDIVNYTGHVVDTSRLIHQSCRLFRRRKNYLYTGRVHEQITPSILREQPQAQILRTNLQIFHYGYMESNPERRAKVERNIVLLQRELQQTAENSFLEYHLGIACFELGKKQEALDWLIKSYNHLHKGFAFTPTLIRNIALCLIDLDSCERAIQFIRREVVNYPDYTDLLYLWGVALLKQKQYSEAIRQFQQCILLGESEGKYTTTAGTGSYLAYFNLGKAYQGLGEGEKAAEAYINAVHTEPNYVEPLYPLTALLFHQHKNIDQVIGRLETEFDFTSTYGMAIMADLCGLLREDELALGYLERSRKIGDDLPLELQILYAKSLLGVGRYNQARDEILRVLSQEESPDLFVLELCIAQWLRNPRESIGQLEPAVLERLDMSSRNVLWIIDRLWLEEKEAEGKSSVWGRVKRVFTPEEAAKEKPVNLNDSAQELLLILDKILRYRGYDLFVKASGLLLELDFPRWKLHFHRGELYYKYGCFNEAIEEFFQIVEMNVQDERVYYYLGCICEERGVLADAENLFCHALNLNDRELEYHLGAARVALKRARNLAGQIVQRIPKSPFFVTQLSIIEECLKKVNMGGG